MCARSLFLRAYVLPQLGGAVIETRPSAYAQSSLVEMQDALIDFSAIIGRWMKVTQPMNKFLEAFAGRVFWKIENCLKPLFCVKEKRSNISWANNTCGIRVKYIFIAIVHIILIESKILMLFGSWYKIWKPNFTSN